MKSITELREQLNASTIELLVSDTQLAMTFLDLAEQPSATREDRERRFQEAARAYDVIQKIAARTTLTQEENEVLMRRLIVLRGRLDRHLATFRKVA